MSVKTTWPRALWTSEFDGVQPDLSGYGFDRLVPIDQSRRRSQRFNEYGTSLTFVGLAAIHNERPKPIETERRSARGLIRRAVVKCWAEIAKPVVP